MSLSVFPELVDDTDIIESFAMELRNPNSIAQLSVSVESQSNADFVDLKFSFGENEIAPPSFNGKYEGSPFSAVLNVNISMPQNMEGQPSGTATLVSLKLLGYDCNPGYTASELLPNKINLEGATIKVFNDQVYEFLMSDLKTVKNLSADTDEKYAAIVKWIPPRIKEIALMHYFSVIVTYDETGTGFGSQRYTSVVTLTLPQTIRWNYNTAVAKFNELLQRGTI